MAFPHERNLSDDVHELYRRSSANVRPRKLGHSSMSPGEGTLDVLDTGGNDVARVGEGGIWVPDGVGGWVTQNYINGLNATFRSTAATQISDLQDASTVTNSRIDAVWSAVDQRTGRIANLESWSTGVNNHMTTAASQIALMYTYMASLAAHMNALRTWLIDNVGGTPPVRPNPPII